MVRKNLNFQFQGQSVNEVNVIDESLILYLGGLYLIH